jgi:hypothetical protein
MYGALVQFPAESRLTTEETRVRWEAIAPVFEREPGFIHKAFLRSPDGSTWGGFYIWETEDAAKAYYNEAWRERMAARYGQPPSVTYFDVPAVSGSSARPGLVLAGR